MKGTQMHLFSSEESEKTQDKRHALVMPLDTTILLLVVGILLLALSFSLGVEKGRRNAMRTFEKERTNMIAETEKAMAIQKQYQQAIPEQTEPQQFAVVQEQAQIPVTPVPQRPVAITLPETAPAVVAAPEPRAPGVKKYVIQVASYAGKDQAESAAKKIRQEGYPAYVAQKGKFLAILVGEFKDEKTAKSNFESLKRKYKDCILKKI